MAIKIFITGGTIDGHDYSDPALTPETYKSSIPNLLKQGRIGLSYDFEVLMNKDSRVITEEDREYIAVKCSTTAGDRIVITHGTATLIETARYLDDKIKGKTVILVGSQVPADEPNSDALFNLGAAFIAAQILEKGIYIVMNGKIFYPENVRKNRKLKIFEEINGH